MSYEQAAFKQRQVFPLKNGRKVELSQLGMQDFIQLKAEALKRYRREQIEAVTDNLDLVPEDRRDKLIEDAIYKAREVTAANLPQQKIQWPLRDNKGQLLKDDNGFPLTKEIPVPYEMWWMSETPEGKLQAAWLSIRACKGQEDFTIEQVDELFKDALDELDEAANLVGEMSAPKIKKKPTRRERRRMKRTGR